MTSRLRNPMAHKRTAPEPREMQQEPIAPSAPTGQPQLIWRLSIQGKVGVPQSPPYRSSMQPLCRVSQWRLYAMYCQPKSRPRPAATAAKPTLAIRSNARASTVHSLSRASSDHGLTWTQRLNNIGLTKHRGKNTRTMGEPTGPARRVELWCPELEVHFKKVPKIAAIRRCKSS